MPKQEKTDGKSVGVLPDLGLNYFDSGQIKGVVSERVEKEIYSIISQVAPEVYENYKISNCYMPWCRMFEVALEVEKRDE